MPSRILRIYFADDDPDDHEIFTTVVNESFPLITVHTFFDCGNLLKYIDDPDRPLPNLIFLDYNMPGNNGNECLQKIKKTARLLHIPIIIYSTSDHDVVIKKSLEYGAYKYIVKPNSLTDLKQELQVVLSELETA